MQNVKQMDVSEIGLEATTGTPVVLLREQEAPHRLIPIFIGAPEAASIAASTVGHSSPRPLTHDLMASLLDVLHADLESVEVTEIREGSFLARITVHTDSGRHHLDARPSDAIALAVRTGCSVLVTDAVLDEAGTFPEPDGDPAEPGDDGLDAATIDETVEEFRTFLEDVDPSWFDDAGGD